MLFNTPTFKIGHLIREFCMLPNKTW